MRTTPRVKGWGDPHSAAPSGLRNRREPEIPVGWEEVLHSSPRGRASPCPLPLDEGPFSPGAPLFWAKDPPPTALVYSFGQFGN